MTGSSNDLPVVLAQLTSERTAQVVFGSSTYEVSGRDVADTRAQALHQVAAIAANMVAGPVQVTLTDPDGVAWRLVMQPDGEVTDEAPASAGQRPQAPGAQERQAHERQAQAGTPSEPEMVREIPDEHTIPGRERGAASHASFAPPGWQVPEDRPGADQHPSAGAASGQQHPEAGQQHPEVGPAQGSVASAFRDPAAWSGELGGHPHTEAGPTDASPTGAPGAAPAAQQVYPAHQPPSGHGAHQPQPGYPVDQPQPGHHSVPHPGVPAPATAAPGYPEPAPGGPHQVSAPDQAAPDLTESEQHMRRRDMRESFLRSEQVEAPASQGLRGALTRVGIRTRPSDAERALRADVDAVSQHWPGVRTVAVVNGKGGANKTPTTALLAAVFARNSGAATLAWDNNETRGTLGWRTEQGKHEATVQDLLPRGEALLDPSAKAGDISHFVHHQAADKYDVLRSNPSLLSSEQRISGDDVDLVHDVAGRYYRLIFIDSGNDESAGHWLRMIDKVDQLVVATIAKPEHAEAGALLLEALSNRTERTAELARNAVVVVSQARERDVQPSAAEIAQGFRGWVRDVVTIPYDRAMVESVLRFESLAQGTQRAWLRAGAAVAAGL